MSTLARWCCRRGYLHFAARQRAAVGRCREGISSDRGGPGRVTRLLCCGVAPQVEGLREIVLRVRTSKGALHLSFAHPLIPPASRRHDVAALFLPFPPVSSPGFYPRVAPSTPKTESCIGSSRQLPTTASTAATATVRAPRRRHHTAWWRSDCVPAATPTAAAAAASCRQVKE